MNTTDLATIRNRRPDFAAGESVRLIVTADPRSAALQRFCENLADELPGFRFQLEQDTEAVLPFIDAGDGLCFRAVPSGGELAPFLDALSPKARLAAAPPADQRPLLDRIPLPRDVRLYVASACPHCPASIRQWAGLVRFAPNLRLWVVDAALFPEAAEADGVRAVPTLVLDQDWRWSGQIPVTDVLNQLYELNPARLSATALEGLLKEGQAGAVSRAMQAQQIVFPALIELLTHPKWSTRLGAMVAMENLAEADPQLARTAVPLLQARFAELDDQTKGDVLYTLGETAGRQELEWIEAARAASGGGELAQAATEAAARVRERQAARDRAQG
jgi:hypothetical protein